MSSPLVAHSPDLQRLQDEGYDIEIRSDHLLVKHVPYVTADRTVAYGILISELSTNGSSTITPGTHVAMFTGSIPHDHHGRPLEKILSERTRPSRSSTTSSPNAPSPASRRPGTRTTTPR